MAETTPTSPNFLFFFPDQHRGDYIGPAGKVPVRTPNLDDLARRGMYFPRAITSSPLCAPVRACLACGMAYPRTGVLDNAQDLPLELETYYQRLRDAGYRVAGVGKFDLHKATMDWNLDGSRLLAEWGFTEGIDNEGKGDGRASGAVEPKGPYLAYLHERGLADAHVQDYKRRGGDPAAVTPLPEEAYCDNWIAENGLRFLREFPADQPWHLVVNFTGPHPPWDVTQRMRDRWCDVEFPPAFKPGDRLPPEVVNACRQNYAAMIENIDRHVGRFIEEVRRRGELDRTLIVYASDHGEMLYDRGLAGKQVPYQPSVSVPLIIAGPGVSEGEISEALVQIYDLSATFLDYADAGPLQEGDALSLRPVLEGRRDRHRELLMSGLTSTVEKHDFDWRCATDGRFKLVVGYFEEPTLFDLETDPDETVNVAAQHPEIVRRMLAFLAEEDGEYIARRGFTAG